MMNQIGFDAPVQRVQMDNAGELADPHATASHGQGMERKACIPDDALAAAGRGGYVNVETGLTRSYRQWHPVRVESIDRVVYEEQLESRRHGASF
jgi:hypothetical protein